MICIISDEVEDMALELENGCFRWQENEWADITPKPDDVNNYQVATPFQLKSLSMYVKKVRA